MYGQILKARGWTPYKGKGKRTGSPGHYQYDYGQGALPLGEVAPRQLSLGGAPAQPTRRNQTRHGHGVDTARPRDQLDLLSYRAPAPAPAPQLPNPAKRLRGETYWARHGAQGAPQAGEKGYRGPAPGPEQGEAAEGIVGALRRAVADPDWAGAYSWHAEHGSADNEPDPTHGLSMVDLAAYPGLPVGDLRGAVALVLGEGHGGVAPGREAKQHAKGRVVRHTTERVGAAGGAPRWLLEAIVEDSMDATTKKRRIVNVSKVEAERFINQHHSAFEGFNPRGLVFAVGLRVGGRLVAVATANTPSGGGDPAKKANELELTRIASDGTTPFASSALAGQILAAMEKTGRGRLVTYSLSTEKGSTYRALEGKGMRPVGWVTRGGGKQSKERRSDEFKIRWEAGPDASEADPKVLKTLDRLHTLHGELERTDRGRLFAGLDATDYAAQAAQAVPVIARWAAARGLDTPTLRKLVAMRGQPGLGKRPALIQQLAETL
jgi:hypothetical protein